MLAKYTQQQSLTKVTKSAKLNITIPKERRFSVWTIQILVLKQLMLRPELLTPINGETLDYGHVEMFNLSSEGTFTWSIFDFDGLDDLLADLENFEIPDPLAGVYTAEQTTLSNIETSLHRDLQGNFAETWDSNTIYEVTLISYDGNQKSIILVPSLEHTNIWLINIIESPQNESSWAIAEQSAWF